MRIRTFSGLRVASCGTHHKPLASCTQSTMASERFPRWTVIARCHAVGQLPPVSAQVNNKVDPWRVCLRTWMSPVEPYAHKQAFIRALTSASWINEMVIQRGLHIWCAIWVHDSWGTERLQDSRIKLSTGCCGPQVMARTVLNGVCVLQVGGGPTG